MTCDVSPVAMFIMEYVLYVCQAKTNIWYFFLFFCTFFNIFNCLLEKKNQKNVSFYGVCMYVRPKLTFVSFYFCFFLHLPLISFYRILRRNQGLRCDWKYLKFNCFMKFRPNSWNMQQQWYWNGPDFAEKAWIFAFLLSAKGNSWIQNLLSQTLLSVTTIHPWTLLFTP